jgi:hypothetical protein
LTDTEIDSKKVKNKLRNGRRKVRGGKGKRIGPDSQKDVVDDKAGVG